MTKIWSWEEMDYLDDGQPTLLPDLWIEPGATCAYCEKTEEASGQRLAVLCGQCGGVAHYLCAVDCAPYDASEEYNDFVCGACLNWTPDQAREHAESLTRLAPVAVGTTSASAPGDDFDPFLDSDDLP